jgi:hypothetical protein
MSDQRRLCSDPPLSLHCHYNGDMYCNKACTGTGMQCTMFTQATQQLSEDGDHSSLLRLSNIPSMLYGIH